MSTHMNTITSFFFLPIALSNKKPTSPSTTMVTTPSLPISPRVPSSPRRAQSPGTGVGQEMAGIPPADAALLVRAGEAAQQARNRGRGRGVRVFAADTLLFSDLPRRHRRRHSADGDTRAARVIPPPRSSSASPRVAPWSTSPATPPTASKVGNKDLAITTTTTNTASTNEEEEEEEDDNDSTPSLTFSATSISSSGPPSPSSDF